MIFEVSILVGCVSKRGGTDYMDRNSLNIHRCMLCKRTTSLQSMFTPKPGCLQRAHSFPADKFSCQGSRVFTRARRVVDNFGNPIFKVLWLIVQVKNTATEGVENLMSTICCCITKGWERTSRPSLDT